MDWNFDRMYTCLLSTISPSQYKNIARSHLVSKSDNTGTASSYFAAINVYIWASSFDLILPKILRKQAKIYS